MWVLAEEEKQSFEAVNRMGWTLENGFPDVVEVFVVKNEPTWDHRNRRVSRKMGSNPRPMHSRSSYNALSCSLFREDEKPQKAPCLEHPKARPATSRRRNAVGDSRTRMVGEKGGKKGVSPWIGTSRYEW